MNKIKMYLLLSKKRLYKLFLLLSIIYVQFPVSSEEFSTGNNIHIHSIELGKMEGDIAPSEFSVKIHFSNSGNDIDKWHLGFYMLNSFYQLRHGEQNYNPRLRMEISDNNGHSAKLNYAKEHNIKKNDLSHGYLTILMPNTAFPLKKKKSYTIHLLHNNQWGGGTISYFPQNFFIMLPQRKLVNKKRKIYQVATDLKAYKFVNYDRNAAEMSIQNHIKENWNNSAPFKSSSHSVNIVPSPYYINVDGNGFYYLQKNIKIHNLLSQDNSIAYQIAEALRHDFNIKLEVDNDKKAHTGIVIEPITHQNQINNNPEGYILKISANKILIQAFNDAGVYYAFQSLRQIWNNLADKKNIRLPILEIKDYPRFHYRGIMLDTVRHFFNVEEIKKFIDIMAAHKLNVLHLHLADDEGFRLALSEFSVIRSIGSRRGIDLPLGPTFLVQENFFAPHKTNFNVSPDTIYSGFYTEKDIKELIAYANANQITIIPEIDLPSHSRALIKALPDIFVDPNDKSQYVSAQGYTDNVLPICTYNTSQSVGPRFTQTINTMINIIANLFDGQKTVYAIQKEISIGGDEVSPNAWTNSGSCQSSLKTLTALQKSHHFFYAMSNSNPSIVLSGWQQFVQTNDDHLGNMVVPAQKAGHVWVWNATQHGIPQARVLARAGYKTVLVFSDKTYFDLIYVPDIKEPGLAWASQYSDTQLALSSSLAATITLSELDEASQNNVVGIEGTLWSENLFNFHQLTYMAIPKMAGLSEASWSPASITSNINRVNWQSLAVRLGCGETGFLAYLNRLFGVHYRGHPRGISYEVPEAICN